MTNNRREILQTMRGQQVLKKIYKKFADRFLAYTHPGEYL